MTIDVSALVDIDSGLIDRRIFSDQAIYDLEMEKIFRKTWLLLGHESELRNRNDFFTTWMGEDPVVVTRTDTGEVRAFLNMCRHRGGTICRVDRGNGKSFLCPYHGWSFLNDGRLASVPNLKADYQDSLNVEDWGLIPVSKIEIYKGLIFATWNDDAEPLAEFLGDMVFYLDCLLDRMEGGTELVTGMRRWVVPTNWKHAAENFIGDSYHAAFTHYSIFKVPGLEGAINQVKTPQGYSASFPQGHGVGSWIAPPGAAKAGYGHLPGIDDYLASMEADLIERLGKFRATELTPVHGTIFPNFSIEFPFASLHIWHPKGPLKTEVRDLTIVDRNAPEGMKELLRNQCRLRQGPAGTWEQDDMDNWSQVSYSSKSPTGRKYMANYQMGLGREVRDPRLPGRLDNKSSDLNQRGMYARWAELMSAPDDPNAPATRPAAPSSARMCAGEA